MNREEFLYREEKPHYGVYCKKCMSWIKWISIEDIPSGTDIEIKPENKSLF